MLPAVCSGGGSTFGAQGAMATSVCHGLMFACSWRLNSGQPHLLGSQPKEKTSGPSVLLLSADFISRGEKKWIKDKKKTCGPVGQAPRKSPVWEAAAGQPRPLLRTGPQAATLTAGALNVPPQWRKRGRKVLGLTEKSEDAAEPS